MGWVIILLLTSGCHRHSVSETAIFGADAATEVLQDFHLQDIQERKKAMTLTAVQGRMVDQDQMAELDKPVATFYKNGIESSVLRAPQGRVMMVSHAVEAWGGVTVVTTDHSILTTDRLRYDPQRRLLLSDDPVRLEKPDSITVGKGLTATTDLSHVTIGHEHVQLKKVS